jgi:hypothetical protein
LALFVLAGLGLIVAVVSIGIAIEGPPGLRTGAVGYGILNFGFAVVNGMLGLVLLLVSRGA